MCCFIFFVYKQTLSNKTGGVLELNIKVGMTHVGVTCVLSHLKPDSAYAIDKLLWAIRNMYNVIKQLTIPLRF